VARHAASFAGDATRLVVAGNSSGGNYAAVMAQMELQHLRQFMDVVEERD